MFYLYKYTSSSWTAIVALKGKIQYDWFSQLSSHFTQGATVFMFNYDEVRKLITVSSQIRNLASLSWFFSHILLSFQHKHLH